MRYFTRLEVTCETTQKLFTEVDTLIVRLALDLMKVPVLSPPYTGNTSLPGYGCRRPVNIQPYLVLLVEGGNGVRSGGGWGPLFYFILSRCRFVCLRMDQTDT